MDDEKLLRTSGLILRDSMTGNEGITLAAILLFGPDELIPSKPRSHSSSFFSLAFAAFPATVFFPTGLFSV